MGHFTHSPEVAKSFVINQKKKKAILITKIFKSFSISSTETKLNELLCPHIL